jgi:hypothetical protein
MELLSRFDRGNDPVHLIVVVANHFEPGWAPKGRVLHWKEQRARLEEWHSEAALTGRLVQDHDGTSFRHTPFFPAEQYHPSLIDILAKMQTEGLGEVEVHLHHGIDKPDTPDNLRRVLVDFRDILAERHGCLSRMNGQGTPCYAFVHGNLALANSADGQSCGVDEEMEVLANTGCYADFTLPAINHPAQVPRFNTIYQCGRPLNERAPHRSGPSLRVHGTVVHPILFTGPIVLDWTRRLRGFPVPRVDDGVLTANFPLHISRLHRWRSSNITILGRSEWVFIKLYTHGFFMGDQTATIGDPVRRFWNEVLEYSDRSGKFKIHFASAREAYNMVRAAVDGKNGNPHHYRDYRLHPIMRTDPRKFLCANA